MRKRKPTNPDAILLADRGDDPSIGDEDGHGVRDGVALFTSPHGSYRYVYYVKRKPVSALQVVSKDGVHAKIARVFTDPKFRRQKYATLLLDRARRDFETVEHSTDLTDLGRAWSQSVGEAQETTVQPDWSSTFQKYIDALDAIYFDASYDASQLSDSARTNRLTKLNERLFAIGYELIDFAGVFADGEIERDPNQEHFLAYLDIAEPMAYGNIVYTEPKRWEKLKTKRTVHVGDQWLLEAALWCFRRREGWRFLDIRMRAGESTKDIEECRERWQTATDRPVTPARTTQKPKERVGARENPIEAKENPASGESLICMGRKVEIVLHDPPLGVDTRSKRVVPARDAGMLYDESGTYWPRCSLLIAKFERGKKESDEGSAYFGRNATVYEGNVELPPVDINAWHKLGEVDQIFYDRAGTKYPGFFRHEFNKPKGLYRLVFMFKSASKKPAVLYSLWRRKTGERFYRIELPEGCVVDDRGIVLP